MEEIVMVSRQFQHPTLLGLLEEKYRVHRLWEASEPEEFIKNHCQGARAMVTDHFGANDPEYFWQRPSATVDSRGLVAKSGF